MYNTLNYDVGYATASAITGPYTKAQAPDAPLLVSGDSSDADDLVALVALISMPMARRLYSMPSRRAKT